MLWGAGCFVGRETRLRRVDVLGEAGRKVSAWGWPRKEGRGGEGKER